MNSHFECSICSDSYVIPTRIPRGCSKCGNNVCEQCLTDIKAKTGQYSCPFCKGVAGQMWAKNLPLIQILEQNSAGMVCAPHKKKVVSLCCNSSCKLPAGICDRADCSRMHLEFGTNSLPVSLLCEDSKEKPEEIKLYVDHLYREFEHFIVKFLKDRKGKAASEYASLGSPKEKIGKIMAMSSLELSTLKSKLMASESKIRQSREEVLEKQQKVLTKDLMDAVNGLKISYDNIIHVEPEVKAEPMKIEKPVMKTDSYEYLYSFISSILEKKFSSTRIFNSAADNPNDFKRMMAGQSNILFRVELQDGTIFGSFIKVEYPRNITGDRQYKDPSAFVYWQNERTYFPAERLTPSQFDVSKNFLLSVGNTNHWDGFWMQNNFRILNPGRETLTMVSDQYTGLFISFATNFIKKFEAIRLNFN